MPESLLAAQKRERDRILAELVKIRGFMPLLMKPRNGVHWTPQERDELAMQLRAVAHLSPYLAVTVLPGSFLLLPLLAWWLDRRRHRRSNAGPGRGAGGRDHRKDAAADPKGPEALEIRAFRGCARAWQMA